MKTAIEDIQVGDKVWATDPETGETELKEVTQLFRGQTDEWVHVFAGEEEIVCTPGHPFYLPEKGWINAGELRIGDTLVTLEGSSIIIERIYRERLDNPETTYNFEVEGFHTYYVSDVELLVHNECKGGETEATKRGREVHKNWDYGEGVAKEQRIGPGARVDGIDVKNHIVYELKPNNPCAIQKGLRQLDRYLDILGPEEWAGVLVLYEN